MSRRPTASQALALKAALAVAAQDEPEAPAMPEAPAAKPAASEVSGVARPPGRPRGRRAIAARQTIYLDGPRHDALVRIAEDRGCSVHSLILSGIDYVIGKPTAVGWKSGH